MNLQDQVVSLALAKRLQELGITKTGLFFWVARKDKLLERGIRVFGVAYIHWFHDLDDTDSLDNYEIYPAFTVAELGELIKPINQVDDERNYFTFWDQLGMWVAWEQEHGLYENECHICASTEADARAKMLIHLLENKLMEIPK